MMMIREALLVMLIASLKPRPPRRGHTRSP